MLQKKPTDSNVAESKGTPSTEPFDFLKISEEILNFGNILKSNIDFTGDAFKIFTESLNIMETQASKLASAFGGMRGFTASIKENMAGAAASVIELGGSLQNVADIQEGVVKALQTQTILNKEAYADLYAVGNLVGDGSKVTAESSKKMVEQFVNAGYGLYDVSNQVLGIINKSRELGVTTAAVYGQISANIGKLALYNFENGVQGMAQMAAKAASLRIEMSSTLKIAEELFDPEKAIDMAASMQRLGVNVASLLDPYKLMDMARNDPAKLQEEILKATQALTYFDEKNQKMAILPGAQQTLRELGKALGILPEELAKMALNAGDLDRKLREIKFSPDFAGDEQARTMIANMAQLKDGKYVVTFDEMNKETGQIESVTKEVSQLTKDNKEALVKMNEPAKSAIELQKEANNSLVNINNSIKALKGVVPRRLAASSGITKAQKRAEEIASPVLSGLGAAMGVNRDKKGRLSTDVADKKINAAANKFADELEEVFSGNKSLKDAFLTLGNDAKKALNNADYKKAFIDAYRKDRNERIDKGGTGGVELNEGKILDYFEKAGFDKNDFKSVTPNNVSNTAAPTKLNRSQSDRDNIINSVAQANNQQSSNNNQGYVKEFKSTIDFNLKVDPPDMRAMFMNYLNEIDLGKQLVKQMENYYGNNKALAGNTPSAKINFV
jgi:hypothetical protein